MKNKYFKFFLLSPLVFLYIQNALAQSCGCGGDQTGGIGAPTLPTTLYDWVIRGFRVIDPNEIHGSQGYAVQKFVSTKDRLGYTINFENDGQFANAAAQNVYVYLKVNPQININSFQLKSFGFGPYDFTVPDNTANYTKRLDLRDSLGIYVDVNAGVDVVNNNIFWSFKSIDPQTGQAPNDGRGFLAVSDTGIANKTDTTSKGQGYVTFSIAPTPTLHTGDTLPAQASIVFDVNDALLTNTWTNTIDAVAPTSKIDTAISDQNVITLTWHGQDDPGGSGIKDYAIYYSENGGPYAFYKDQITGLSTTFNATPGSNYCFYSIARDNVGNIEKLNKTCEATTGLLLPVTWLYFNGQPQGKNALLTWATVSEKNTRVFIVERSFNANNFSVIGSVAAAGNNTQISNYTYTDVNAMLLPTTVLYYRLKQVDVDGHFTYSSSVAISIAQTNNGPIVRAYPNPFNQSITLQILNNGILLDKTIDVRLMTTLGQVLYKKAIVNQSNTTISLNDLPNVAKGFYMLNVKIGNQSFSLKMVRK